MPHSTPFYPISFPFYPARPTNGGAFPRALPKPGHWAYEPKINGWRALVHAPTGTMFNRHGERLSIAHEFTDVLDLLRHAWVNPRKQSLLTRVGEWLDCEVLSRRHPLGRGSLVLLDAPFAVPVAWSNRQQVITEALGFVASGGGVLTSWAVEQFRPSENALLSFAYNFQDEATQRAHTAILGNDATIDPDLFPAAAWLRLQAVNKALGHEVFEGFVAKRMDSAYPRQLRSATLEFPYWIKHRWAY